jgi:hypothetical protein
VPDRAALKIILPDKTAIEVGDDFSSATLTRLLATFSGAHALHGCFFFDALHHVRPNEVVLGPISFRLHMP